MWVGRTHEQARGPLYSNHCMDLSSSQANAFSPSARLFALTVICHLTTETCALLTVTGINPGPCLCFGRLLNMS
jgi:hypothetical protein